LAVEGVTVRVLAKCLSLALLVFLLGPAQTSPQRNVDLRFVNYEGLKQAILKQRGKVVVVDFWADF
jgi:hypothetical protein